MLGNKPVLEHDLSIQTAQTENAVIVASEHGHLLYTNARLREWLGMGSGTPTLEVMSQNAHPAENFRELFTEESRAAFQFGGRWVEGGSQLIPGDKGLRMVVTLREMGQEMAVAGGDFDISATMRILDEIGEMVNAALGVDQSLQTILTIIAKNIEIDGGEIALWDVDDEVLYQRGWVGDAGYVLSLASAGGSYKLGEGVTGAIARTRQPLLIPDVNASDAIAPKLDDNPYRSFVGVPLLLADHFLGTLELTHAQPGYFSRRHLALLQAVAKPIATSIHNAEIYAAQVRRIDDIASLQQITQGQDLEADVSEVYTALNKRIANLVDAEVAGVLLYDNRRELLVAQPPFFGLPPQIVSIMAMNVGEGQPTRDIWDNQEYWISNDLAEDPMTENIGLAPVVAAAGLRNLILVVMRIGNQRIGVMFVANKVGLAGFANQDVQNLRILVTQAAIVVENIRLYQLEQRHDTELVGLQEITHAIGALSSEDAEYVYSDINMRIAGLMRIRMVGMLLYDEEQNKLVAQPPFYGVADEQIADYEIDLGANEVIRELWEEEDAWYTNRARADALVFAAGLATLAERLGVEKTLIASLTVGGQKIGVIQVSNKHSGEDFNENDARLLLIFATQAAAILENARLVSEVQRRANEAERLRQLAERAGNVVTLDETLAPVLAEVGALMDSALVVLSVLQEDGALVTTPRSVFGAELNEVIRYDSRSEGYDLCVANTGEPLLANDAPRDLADRPPYNGMVHDLGIYDMVVVPLALGDQRLGELVVANCLRGAYDEGALRLLATIGAQLSSTIDRVRLFAVAGQNLERREKELVAISHVSHTLNQTVELAAILDAVREEAATGTGAVGGTIALVRSVRSFDGMPQRGRPRLVYRSGMQNIMSSLADVEKAALAAPDGVVVVGDYAATDMLPLPANAVSAVALTFSYAEFPVGVIYLYDRRPNWFDERSVSFLRTLGSKASLGYGNALRYHEQMQRGEEMRKRVAQLNQIFELGQMLQANVDQTMMLESVAHSIVTSASFDVVVVTMVDPVDGMLKRETQAGLPVDTFERSKADMISVEMAESLLFDEHRISESYFYAIEDIIKMEIAGLDALSAAYVGNRTMHGVGPKDWHDGDMLLVPIRGANSELLGIISLDRPQDNLRPDVQKISVLEIFAHQAATTIENTRLYLSSVRSAEQEARLNALLGDIVSTLNVDEIVASVAHNAFRLAPFGRMTAALVQDDGYRLVHVRVEKDDMLVSSEEHRVSLAGTALGRARAENTELMFGPGDDVSAYEDLQAAWDTGERVSLVLPLASGGEVLGALHFGSEQDQGYAVDEATRLFTRVAQLMAVAIQNARLFNQAVNLRLFNESVVESIQQGIVVLDRSGYVLTANQFMEDEYGWDVSRGRMMLFDYSPELVEVLDTPLREVLETAEPQRILNERMQVQLGDLPDFVVRNFYIYPLVAQEVVDGAVLLVEDVTDRARLEANVAERAGQLAALTRASGQITSTLNREAVINTALDVMSDIIEFDTITIWQREGPEYMRLVGAGGVNVPLSPPIRAVVADVTRLSHIVEYQTPMTIGDLGTFLKTYTYALPGDANMQSWMGVPLVYQGTVIGLISLGKVEAAFYGAQGEQAATAFANQVAVALSNAQLFADTNARTERLSVLNRVSLALVQSMDSENIVEIALTEISNTVKAEKARAIMFDPTSEIGRVMVDYPRGEAAPTQRIALRENPLFLYIIERLQPLVHSHDRTKMPEDLSPEIRDHVDVRGLKDYLLVPMVAPGHLIGAFEFETRSGELLLGPETLETSLIIANQSAIAIQNANQLEETTLRTRELQTLLEAANSTSLTMDLNEVFKRVADLFLKALDVDDCAIMILDQMDDMLEVQLDVNRVGNVDRISPEGTRFEVSKYPSRARAIRQRDVVVVTVDDPRADDAERDELLAQGDYARMFVPLVVQNDAIGLIQVEITEAFRVITEQEQRLAQALGSQVAAAIVNARLSAEADAQMNELFTINELSQAISANMNLDGMLQIVREQVPGITGARQLYVALYDDTSNEITFPLFLRHSVVEDIAPRKLGTDEVSFIIRNKRPLLLGSDYFAADEVRSSLGLTNGEGNVKSYLGVPLISGEDVLGVLAVRDEERTRVFGLNDQRILTTVGSQLGATLQNTRLFQRVRNFADQLNTEVQERTEELQEERDRLDMLYQITAELALTLDMDRVLNRALQMMASAAKADDGVILLIDPMTDRLYNRASLTRVEEGEELPSHPAEMLATWLTQTGDAELLVDDLTEMDYWDTTVPGAEPWRSAMAVLLENNEDTQGVLVLLSKSVAGFSEGLLNVVIAAANQVASAINNADLYSLIREQAERLGTLLRTEQEQTEKSNAILEGIADGVMLTNPEGEINLFNSAAEEMLGLPRDQVLGRTLPTLIAEYGGNVAAWAEPLMVWSMTKQATDSGVYPTDRIDIGDRVVSVNIAPVYTGEESLGMVSVFRDVTRDVEVDNLKNEFVLNVTHEFRTPMTSIKLASEMLLSGMLGEVTEPQMKNMVSIKSNTDRLAALVEDLLTVSKIDAGETLVIEAVDMANVIEIQLTNAQNRHYDKNHTIQLNIDETLPRAALDRRKMLQVVGNLLDNAFHYTPPGGNIEVGLMQDPDQDKSLLMYIKDDGLGIPEAFRERIWDRFSRNEEHVLEMSSSGTGLGLPIVRELIRLHNGEVWFESVEGVGTTFYVTLPIEYKRSASASALNADVVSGD